MQDYTDENGMRYFSNISGERINYPAGTRFNDGHVQPSYVAAVAPDAGEWCISDGDIRTVFGSGVEFACTNSPAMAAQIVRDHNQRRLLVDALQGVSTWLISPATDAATLREVKAEVDAALVAAVKGGSE